MGPNQRPSPPIPSPRAGRGERPCKGWVLQLLLGLVTVLLWALPLEAQKFYPDDPLTQEPASVSS